MSHVFDLSVLLLVLVGVIVGLTTVLFGFGGGFVAVPVIVWVDHGMGGEALRVATATSLVVMVGNALVATAATPRATLSWLSSRRLLLVALAGGGLIGSLVSTRIPGGWVRWGFVVYTLVTFVDILVRRGFVTTRVNPSVKGGRVTNALPAPVGLPIGAIATVLGVGGSVMTVPALRRSGTPMMQAAALANPLTLAIVAPAMFLTFATEPPISATEFGMVGPVDFVSGLALLVGAIPVIVALRRRPFPIPDRVHAVGYLILLLISAAAVAVS